MESWDAATWAKVASHAALVAAHLKELESVSSPASSMQIRHEPSEQERIALEGLLGSARTDAQPFKSSASLPVPMLGCVVPQIYKQPQTYNQYGASIDNHSDTSASTSSAEKSTALSVSNSRKGKQTKTTDKPSNRIDRLREYDRAKKREQRDRHTELFRKVHMLRHVVS